MIIKSLKELVNVGKVKYSDTLSFTVGEETLDYVVCGHFLLNNSGSNDTIFNKLDLKKVTFCTKAYGYNADDNAFPKSEYEDYNALYRVALALFVECEIYNATHLIKDTITFTAEDGQTIELSKKSVEAIKKIKIND